MLSSKTKKFLLFVSAIFGGIVLAAAFLRAQAQSKSAGTPLTQNLGAQLKAVTNFNA